MTVVESEVCPYFSCGVDSHALPLTVRIDASTTCSAASKLPSILMVDNPFHLPLLKWMTLDEWTSSETILADWSLSKRHHPVLSSVFVIAKKRCRKNRKMFTGFLAQAPFTPWRYLVLAFYINHVPVRATTLQGLVAKIHTPANAIKSNLFGKYMFYRSDGFSPKICPRSQCHQERRPAMRTIIQTIRLFPEDAFLKEKLYVKSLLSTNRWRKRVIHKDKIFFFGNNKNAHPSIHPDICRNNATWRSSWIRQFFCHSESTRFAFTWVIFRRQLKQKGTPWQESNDDKREARSRWSDPRSKNEIMDDWWSMLNVRDKITSHTIWRFFSYSCFDRQSSPCIFEYFFF